jgi:DNA-binding transcriptional LysR family regulator
MASDRFREFEVFVCVIDTGSFSAAARRLDCTPSAVSKLIDRLEARIGMRLLQRTSRALTLTVEGRAFQRAAVHALEAVSEAESLMLDVTAPAAGTLKVHTTLNFAHHQLAPILPEFLTRHPLVRLEFFLHSDPVDLIQADIDLSIQLGVVTNPNLVAKRIATTHWVVCAAPSYLKRHGTPRSPDDLQNHNCLNFLPNMQRSMWPMRIDEASGPPQIAGNIAANSDNFLRVLACRGMGIARLADFHIGQDLHEGRLVALLSEYQRDEPEPIYAVFQSRRNLSLRVKVFLKFLESKLPRVIPGKAV